MSVRPLSLLLTLAALPLAAAEPVVEAGVAARVNDAGRDAFFTVSEDGDTLVGFLPRGRDGWSRELYVSVGPGLAAFAAGDMDGDGVIDLAVVRRDRTLIIWRGDGEGRFDPKLNSRRELPWLPREIALVREGRHDLPDLFAVGSDGSRLRLSNDGFAVFGRDSALPPGEPFRAASSRLITLGDRGIAARIAPDGAIELSGPGAPAVALRAPFAVRAAAAGDFDGDSVVDLAIAGYGARPDFAFLPGGGPRAREGFAQPLLPAANCAVAAQPSLTFNPATCNINVNDTVTWSGLGFHTATSGNTTTCVADGTFRRTNTTPVTFASSGTFPYYCEPHCSFGMAGTVNVAGGPAAPGTVPDTGTPFRVAKNGTVTTNLDLTWGASCGGAATTSYEVYQGTLPISPAYNHASLNCNLGNVTATTVTPGAGSRYYLIVPRNGSNEGSYGRDSANAQIPPPAAGACLTQNLSGGC